MLGPGTRNVFFGLFAFMIGIFILGIIVVMLYYIVGVAETELLSKAPMIQELLGEGDNATKIIEDTVGEVGNAYESLKWITVMIISFMALAFLIIAYFSRFHPVLFIVYIFMVILAIIMSVPISNAYETIYTNPTLASAFTGFWGQTFIFLNLPYWITALGMIGGILIFIGMSRGQAEFGGIR